MIGPKNLRALLQSEGPNWESGQFRPVVTALQANFVGYCSPGFTKSITAATADPLRGSGKPISPGGFTWPHDKSCVD